MTRWVLPLAALAILSAALPSGEASHGGVIRVTGDTGFDAAHWSGTGSAADPYRLLTTSLLAREGAAIELANTQKHVNLSGLSVSGGAGHSDALHLYNVRNVTLWGSTFETNRWGVHVRDSQDVVIAGNTLKTSAGGVWLEASRNVTLRDNRISLNDKDVAFSRSAGNVLRNNNLSTASGQIGLHFDDNASYDNRIDPTNVVNAIPIRWYSGIANETIGDFTVDLAGITNVAQVMVHNATNVRLERVVAKSGAGAGIVLHRSNGVTLERSIAENHRASGILVELSNGTRIANASVRTNAQSGIELRSSQDVIVENSTLSANGREGVRVAASADRATLRGLTLSANAQRGLHAEASATLRLSNSTLAGDGVFLSSTTDALVRDNTLEGAGGVGLSIAGSVGRFEANVIRDRASAIAFSGATRSNFSGNLVTLPRDGIGFSFDGAGSYDNEISTTNLVNGTPVRWYTNVVGPVTLEGVDVVQRGVTNVAQIMLYRSANVTLANATARNGVAVGILVHQGNNVTVSSVATSANAAEGLLVDASPTLRIAAGTFEANGGDGIRLKGLHAPLVENALVANGRARGIAVEGGSAPTIRGNAVHANAATGILVQDVGPGAAAIDHNAVERHPGGGIQVARSTLGSVRGNTLTSNGGDGIALALLPAGARLDANAIVNHTRGIRLGAAEGTQLANNTITIGAGQTGVHFDDEPSYNVSLPTTNTVNGVPMRWYVGLVNATVADARVELAGITNVAQIMIHKGANVTLESAVATNGSARGVYVHRSENATVVRARVENNSNAGLLAYAAPGLRVEGGIFERGRAEGIRLEATSRAYWGNLTARSNAAAGAHADASSWVSVFASTFDDNAGAGLSFSGASGLRIENSTFARGKGGGIWALGSGIDILANGTFTNNTGHGLSLSGSGARSVDRNSFLQHARAVSLSQVMSATFTNNTVTLAQGETAWQLAPDSYWNEIGPTNLVNGVPMRWHAGPVNATIAGIRANVPGMTNVAQVGLIGARNVTLVDAEASQGAGAGILLVGGTDVSLLGSRATQNVAEGVRAEGTSGLTLRNDSLSGNAIGLQLVAARSVMLDNLTVEDNRGHGIADKDGVDLRLHDSSISRNGGHGVSASRTSPLNVSRVSVAGAGQDGLSFSEVVDLRAYDDRVREVKGAGIAVHKASVGARIEGNEVANASFGIRLSATEFSEHHRNRVTIAPGQIGWQFEDETSYNNVIPTTNTVNDAPLHWYTALAGTESQPVTLPGVRAELRGITNVAQVMLYRSAYVNVPDLVATNGTARGVYLYRSSAVTLVGANLSGNSVAGADLYAAQSSRIAGGVAQGSATGVRLAGSHSNVVEGLNASGAATGVRVLGDSYDNRVERIETNGTSRGIRDDGWNGAGLAGNNLLADAGPAKRTRIGGTLSFSEVVATHRHESKRIVEQRWIWGDGTPDTVGTGDLLRPTHLFQAEGRYRVDLKLSLADGDVARASTWVDVVPPLSEPRALLAYPGDGNVTLTWTAPLHDGASAVTSYRIYRGPDLATLAIFASTPDTRFVDTGVSNGRTYVYAIAAQNADGEGPRAFTAAIPVAPPAAPTALVATPHPNAVALAWQAPSQTNGAPILGYVVLRASGSGALAPVAVLGNVTSTNDTGLTNGVRYTYAVRAYNALGNGTTSANATATPIGPPAAPIVLRTLPGDASAVVVWSAPADTGGTPITGYRIWRAAADESLAQLPPTLAANASAWRDTGLSNGERYRYAVSAINAYSEGPASAPVNVTPTALDALLPVVYAHEPPPGAILAASPPFVAAQFVDNDGVVVESIALYLDGARVGAIVDNASARYEVPAPLARGEHTVRLVARDPSGNEANETWTFRVLGEEDLVARFEESGHVLVPARARPGEPVTARLTLRNVGYVGGTAIVRVLEGNHSLGLQVVELDAAASAEVAIEIAAPELGVHLLRVGETDLELVVAEELIDAPTPPPDVVDPAAVEEPPAPGGPRKPVRGNPPPRAPEESTNETPFPLVVTLLALAATALRRGRRG